MKVFQGQGQFNKRFCVYQHYFYLIFNKNYAILARKVQAMEKIKMLVRGRIPGGGGPKKGIK